MRHRFKIGDTVTFEPTKSARPAASTSYKVLRLLPVEYGVCRYRIKSAAEVVNISTNTRLHLFIVAFRIDKVGLESKLPVVVISPVSHLCW